MNEKRYFIKKSFHKCHTSKIIFLDVDGVLNHHPLRNDNYDLEPDLLDNLELIVKKTKAAIMLTSSWSFGMFNEEDDIKSNEKYPSHLLNELNKRDINIIGYALNSQQLPYSRSQLIIDFLNDYSISEYAIIDDEIFDFEKQGLGDHFIQTYFQNNSELGLSGSKVEKTIKLLIGQHT